MESASFIIDLPNHTSIQWIFQPAIFDDTRGYSKNSMPKKFLKQYSQLDETVLSPQRPVAQLVQVKMPWCGLRKAAQSGWTVKLQLADVPDAQVPQERSQGERAKLLDQVRLTGIFGGNIYIYM